MSKIVNDVIRWVENYTGKKFHALMSEAIRVILAG